MTIFSFLRARLLTQLLRPASSNNADDVDSKEKKTLIASSYRGGHLGDRQLQSNFHSNFEKEEYSLIFTCIGKDYFDERFFNKKDDKIFRILSYGSGADTDVQQSRAWIFVSRFHDQLPLNSTI